ncbi:MAG: ribosome biogenesis GTPase Der [Acidimicrobiaceae bacterium]|nr:ribosome biogenesis GTPase Der [Acidimicrobiaceae bacterium]
MLNKLENHPLKESCPVVAVVGRPNVGKSTLVNRAARRREVIVQEEPGVTRDSKVVEADWDNQRFVLVDTGGWSNDRNNTLTVKVNAQAQKAINRADVILFVVDSRTGLTKDDHLIAQQLHSTKAAILVVANKIDHPNQDDSMWEFVGLGMGDPHPVSCLNGNGFSELLDVLVSQFADNQSTDSSGNTGSSDPLKIANTLKECDFSVVLVGRPNTGKSTLFNRLTNEELAIVHDQPGTTRDSIDTVIETEIGVVRFVDTAGLRRRANIDSSVEYYSLIQTLKSVESVDVAVVVVDSVVGITRQDQRIVERVNAAGCPIVLLLNKWDSPDTETRLRVRGEVKRKLGFLGDMPVLQASGLTGRNLSRLWRLLEVAIRNHQSHIPTSHVNHAIQTAQLRHPAPNGARILYAVQGATHPPTFTLFVNRKIPSTYLRYIKRSLKETLNLNTTAIKLRVRHQR